MTTTDTDAQSQETNTPPETVSVDALVNPLAAVALQDSTQPEQEGDQNATSHPRPLCVYTRSQMLHLHKSPLVKPPADMPELKDWFG